MGNLAFYSITKGKNDFNATITIRDIIDVSTFTSFSNTLITTGQTGSNSIRYNWNNRIWK